MSTKCEGSFAVVRTLSALRINEVDIESRNSTNVSDGDPGFEELIDALTRIQRAGGLGFRTESRKDGSAVILVMHRRDADKALAEDLRRVGELLRLAGDTEEYDVTYGLVPRNGRELAVVTRSMLEIMLNLGAGVELPPEHIGSGRALPGRPTDSKAAPLVRIHSSLSAPTDAYAAVPFKGYWYWIADDDIVSKRPFTFLMLLFSLAETGQSAAAPVVTVPSR